MFERYARVIEETNLIGFEGRLTAVTGLTLQAEGLPAEIGTLCAIRPRRANNVLAQVVGFEGRRTVLMPLGTAGAVAVGDAVVTSASMQRVGVGPALLGRVIDGLGRPIDGGAPIHAHDFYELDRPAPAPLSRHPIDEPLGTGIRALDSTLTIGLGQRIGIFAGTGVGKSVLMGMVSRYTAADVIVVALVGERGREVQDFIRKDLGEEGLQRAIMVVSTSDESPVMRVRACFLATAVAEYFRDSGQNVLLLMDSLTRLAMAQREIGLVGGEPPSTKGYTPSVFALLPKLLERSGRTDQGSITGFYSVLVEADDINEPIADAVRGILDGHVWLNRALAGKGHYPAIDVLNSISRLMVDVVDTEHLEAARRVRQVLGTWFEIEDLVNIGAYARGSNPEFDLAIESKPIIDAFLQQAVEERVSLVDARTALVDVARRIDAAAGKLKAA